MTTNLKVKKGDNVYILAGVDKGKTGKVLNVDRKSMRAIVEGIAMATKHKKPKGAQDPGGLVQMERAISLSNVMVVCTSCKKPSKLGIKITGEGKDKEKARVCKKCNSEVKTASQKD